MPYDYGNKEAEQIIESLYRNGFTQEGVNRVYELLGLGPAPAVPPELIGNRPGVGRTAVSIFGPNGERIGPRTGGVGDFLNLFGRQAVDPYREYGVGNYLGLAGLAVGAAGAAGAFNGLAPGASAGSSAASAGTTSGSSGLGIFSNGGVNGLAGLGGGNAGALAASGGIAGGAGGTAAGALGGLGGLLGGGEGMGWNWDTVIDLGGNLLGGWLESEGAKDAARASERGILAGIAENRRQYDTSRADLMPWLTAGRNALGRLEDPNAFTASPSYNFVRNEGMRGIENSFAARGGAASGNALRALSEFNAGLASQEHNNWWNQQAGLAGVGQTTAQNLGVLGANNAANVGGLLQDRGNARASGIAGSTNAYTNLLQNLLSSYNRRNTLGA